MYIFAVATSKFEGTRLENEQIEQIHVALPSLGVKLPDIEVVKGLIAVGSGERLKPREVFVVVGCDFEARTWLSLGA